MTWKHIVSLVAFAVVFLTLCEYSAEAKTKSANKKGRKTSVAPKQKRTKTKTAARQKKNKKKNSVSERFPSLTSSIDTLISNNVRYREVHFGKSNIIAHTIEFQNSDPTLKLSILKGLDYISGLERLGDLLIRTDSATSDSVLVAINANFWSAYRNLPIGPLIVDGDVVQSSHHKLWSSAFFDEKNRAIIDTFRLEGTAIFPDGKKYPIGSVNARRDSASFVLYNAYAGKTVPFVHARNLEKIVQEFLDNHSLATGDSTEAELDMEQLRASLAAAKRETDSEFPMRKILLRRLRNPVVNLATPCVVLGVDGGDVSMPLRGCVLSVPSWFPDDNLPIYGDTIIVQFSTNPYPFKRFYNAISGTPRLVRNGIAKHEALEEGAKAVRFRNHPLARTAIGVSRDGRTTYMVMVEPPTAGKRNNGATLQQLSQLMRALGAWNAMNLDGGGSSMMTVCGTNVCTHSTIPTGRKISAALTLFRRAKVLKVRMKTQ